MKLYGKEIKEFLSSKKGVFIDKDDKLVFIDCEHGKSNVIIKPTNEQYPDYIQHVFYSDMFDAVKLLEDDKPFEIKLVFNFIMFEYVNEKGDVEIELAISGERY